MDIRNLTNQEVVISGRRQRWLSGFYHVCRSLVVVDYITRGAKSDLGSYLALAAGSYEEMRDLCRRFNLWDKCKGPASHAKGRKSSFPQCDESERGSWTRWGER